MLIPYWPRLMPEDLAAAYVGVSVSQFRIEQKRGIWPAPIDRGARINTYDREDLDDAIDRLKGCVKHHALDDVDLDREFGIGGNRSPLPRNPPPR